MKRTLSLLLCLIAFLGCSACSVSSPETPGEETPGESEKNYVNDLNCTANSTMFEADNAVYRLTVLSPGSEKLYFSDKDYKCWLPLCGRPDCSHRLKDCNACFEDQLLNGVWLYGRKIYYVVYNAVDMMHPELWCMELDGSEHTMLLKCDLTPPDGRLSMESSSCFFQDRYLVLNYTATEDETTKNRYTIVDLSAGKPEQKELVLKDENGEAYPYHLSPIVGSGSMVILSHLDNELYRADLELGTVTKLCELPFSMTAEHCALNGDELIICEGFAEGRINSVDLETGELTEVSSADPQTKQWYRPYRGYIFGANGSNWPELWHTEIYDMSGNLIVHIPHEAYDDKNLSIVNAVGDYVFAIDVPSGVIKPDYLPEWYLDINDIGTDRLAWRRWAPEE